MNWSWLLAEVWMEYSMAIIYRNSSRKWQFICSISNIDIIANEIRLNFVDRLWNKINERKRFIINAIGSSELSVIKTNKTSIGHLKVHAFAYNRMNGKKKWKYRTKTILDTVVSFSTCQKKTRLKMQKSGLRFCFHSTWDRVESEKKYICLSTINEITRCCIRHESKK